MPIFSVDDIRKSWGGDWAKASDTDLINAYAQQAGMNPSEVAIQLGFDPGSGGMTAKRLSSSINNYQATMYGLGEAVAGKMGLNRVTDWMRRQREENELRANVAAQRAHEMGAVDSYKDVSGIGSGLNYLAGVGIQSLPYLGEAAAWTAADALSGGALTPAALARLGAAAPRAIGGGGLRAGADFAARRAALEEGQGLARSATAAAATYPSSVGDILSNQREQANTMDLGSAALYGVPYAALNMMGLEGAISRGGLLRGAENGGLRGAGIKAGMGALSEGLNESGQEVFNQLGRMAVDPRASLTSDDALNRYAESFVGGAALGGTIGGATGWRKHDLLPRANANGSPSGEAPPRTNYPLAPIGERGLTTVEAPYVEPTTMPRYGAGPSNMLLPPPVARPQTTQDFPNDPIVITPGGTIARMSQLSGSQPDMFGGADVMPDFSPNEVEAPAARTQETGALFQAYPDALVRTEYGLPQITAALRYANGGKYNAQLSRFVPEFSRAIEQGPAAVEALIAKYDNNRSTLRPEVFETAAQMAQDYQSRMVNAQAVGGVFRNNLRPENAWRYSDEVGDFVPDRSTYTNNTQRDNGTSEQIARSQNSQVLLGEQRTAEQQRLADEIADTDARVAGGQQQRTATERMQVIERALQGAKDAGNGRNRAIKALRKAGFRDTMLTEQEQSYIKRHFDLADAIPEEGSALPSAPNEMGEAVAEKPAPASKKPERPKRQNENKSFQLTAPPSTQADLDALQKAQDKRDRKAGTQEQTPPSEEGGANNKQGKLFTVKGKPTVAADNNPPPKEPRKSKVKAKVGDQEVELEVPDAESRVAEMQRDVSKFEAFVACLRKK